MESSCARAAALGLRPVALTEQSGEAVSGLCLGEDSLLPTGGED